jgi:hypothetical protein
MINIVTRARQNLYVVSRLTRAEHDEPIPKVQKGIVGVGLEPNGNGCVVANVAPSTVVLIRTIDFSNVHNFIKHFF